MIIGWPGGQGQTNQLTGVHSIMHLMHSQLMSCNYYVHVHVCDTCIHVHVCASVHVSVHVSVHIHVYTCA